MPRYALAFILATFTASVSAIDADPALGLWLTEANESGGRLQVRIEPCGERLCGVIAKAIDQRGDTHPDYPHLGKTMIRKMRPNGKGKYSKGTIWAPDTDKTYKSKMHLTNDGLRVKGCVAGGLICRGQTWTRVAPQ